MGFDFHGNWGGYRWRYFYAYWNRRPRLGWPRVGLGLCDSGRCLHLCRALLRRICLHFARRRLGLRLFLRDSRRVFCLVYWLESHLGIYDGRNDRGRGLVGLFWETTKTIWVAFTRLFGQWPHHCRRKNSQNARSGWNCSWFFVCVQFTRLSYCLVRYLRVGEGHQRSSQHQQHHRDYEGSGGFVCYRRWFVLRGYRQLDSLHSRSGDWRNGSAALWF